MAKGTENLIKRSMVDQNRKLTKIESCCFIVYFILVTTFVSIVISTVATILITVAYVFPNLITGVIGLYGALKSHIKVMKVYLGFIIGLVCLNIASIILSIIFVCLLAANYGDEKCSSTIDENCSFTDVIIIVLMVMLCLNVVISVCLLFLCYVSYHHGKELNSTFMSMEKKENDTKGDELGY
mmetsp:Transcript_12495/g.12568  ORF Transcript_12495/g.12568 Transcript_12495/m.12568 type:complete len:183 (+) Transcript_12495:24-572(+)|eukprot:CAMPEP_0202946124 /NCGR_PEP_ID=MMETSP1395-20130829/8611_1 /ASSEMBLY_ACC=CAM_ASM_000871 /TAXON_ID=5961 /ORGANISM="Blepharisma japonicum, Strain Stock R1072" /LENGTH=182 /DNA_ID=CAMNT_0049646543 /DNA_START=8 /DNA_END=556 /DNA_ORIENTATION=+